MNVEYKKDLHHNYMVLTESENSKTEPYCVKMLNYHSIKGILSLERRIIDNVVLFYYDITAKQSLNNLFEKSALSYDRIKRLFLQMIETIERAYEYLLIEDDFILAPEYVYMEVAKDIPYLTYLSGYRKNIKEQMSGFIEYLMNKVDYNDKDAVLLVYSLYATSKEEGFTLDHLLELLQNKSHTAQNGKSNVMDSFPLLKVKTNGAEKEKEPHNNIPVMMEKLVGEKEVPYYPLKAYLLTGACGLGSILIIASGFLSRIIYNGIGERIDYSKLFALLLLTLCVDGYLLKKIWDKKNRLTKMVIQQEYIDPREDYEKAPLESDHQSETIAVDDSLRESRNDIINKDENKTTDYRNRDAGRFSEKGATTSVNILLDSKSIQEKEKTGENKKRMGKEKREDWEKSEEIEEDEGSEDDNPTCLLNEVTVKTRFILKPIDTLKGESIPITEFPFFIGKLRKNVDYCLEKDVVSRYHAKITKEQGLYYITDLNSTNGTFLNNEPLQTYQKKELKIGDEIAFANIKFQFILQG